jgi:hypothetical protein
MRWALIVLCAAITAGGMYYGIVSTIRSFDGVIDKKMWG